jgi:adenylate cyclase
VLAFVDTLFWGYCGLFVAVLAARQVRLMVERRGHQATVGYPSGRRVAVAPGTSILDASRQAGIPHASVCGGRGRCSTCRVRIGKGLEELPPPSEAELKVLSRVGAAPNMRLACQTRPTADVEVTPMLPPHATVADAADRPSYMQGQERDIVVVFVDIREFTALSEQRLPYDVVFILNRYFAEMGAGIVDAGGRIDKFIGDGIMALFGVDADLPTASRQAIEAARRMSENLRQLNESLSQEIDRPLRIGVGIHGGPVILGELGYKEVRGLTAIGDTVNTASRLEALTKEHAVQVIVSDAVARAAGADLSAFPATEVTVRGRREAMSVYLVDDGTRLGG